MIFIVGLVDFSGIQIVLWVMCYVFCLCFCVFCRLLLFFSR